MSTTTASTATAPGTSRQSIAPVTFASIAVRVQNALAVTGLDARYLTISLTTMNVGIHGPGWSGPGSTRHFTREQAGDVAAAFGVQDPIYDDHGDEYATVTGRTRDGITLDVFCASSIGEEAQQAAAQPGEDR